ncbi:MAG TPA: FlgD immunoglobulin-like domain containing protein [Candidatus Eisenbacteria bacterium]|nr:FlgD immunoglobulin-like domain containing protein [Candidatus Eisenbacteria bacterium]
MQPCARFAIQVVSFLVLALPSFSLAAVTDTLSSVTLVATFDADTPDAPPDLTLPGPPAGDALTISELSGTIRVRTTVGSLTSQPVEMSQVPGEGSMSMRGVPAAMGGSNRVTVRWRSLARSGGICFLACTMRGPEGGIAASVEYRPEGQLTYNSVGTIGPTLPVSYVPEVDQQFTIVLDFLAQTSSLSIDGVPVVGFQDVPLPQPVTALGSVGFEAGCVATQAFAVDEISAVALVEDTPPSLLAPTIVNGEEGGTITFTVTASDPDGDSIDLLSADLDELIETDATFTPDPGNGSGTFLWHPVVGSAGVYTVPFFASNTMTATVSTQITIGPVGTSVSGTLIWPTNPGDEGEYDVVFTAVNAATSESTSATTHIVVSSPLAAAVPAREARPLAGWLPWAEAPQAPTKGPVISVKTRVDATAGDTVVVVVTAVDADELPPAPTAGTITTAIRAASLVAGTVLLSADLSDLPAGNDATFTTNSQPVVAAPAAVVATEGSTLTIPVSASDPDGDPILDLIALTSGLPAGNDATFTPGPGNHNGTFTWTPAIGQIGAHTVTFRAINALVGNVTTVITVSETVEARAFMPGNDKKIKLETLRPRACLQVELVSSVPVTDIDFTSILMASAGTGSVPEIPAIHAKQGVISDKDENGVLDATICFSKEDLRDLFSLLEGHVLVPVEIRGTLNDGRTFEAGITLDIYATGAALSATIAPNPLNPEAVLTVWNASPGPLRVTVYDASGRLMRVLRIEPSEVGERSIRIDGRGSDGTPLPTGVYFFRVESPDAETAGRFTILK